MGDSAQVLDVDAKKLDTLNNKVIPVILVPGVMGSRLLLPGHEPNWDPDSDGQMVLWGNLDTRLKVKDLNPALTNVDIISDLGSDAVKQIDAEPTLINIAAKKDPSRQVHEVYAARGWGGVASAFYLSLLIQLETKLNLITNGRVVVNHPVYAFGYDWRDDAARSGRKLVTRISQILAENPRAEKVVIVTHSMGALVSRGAMMVDGQTRIAGVVHCMPPVDGTPVAYRRFQTGAASPFDVPQSPQPAVGAIIKQAALNGIMGTDPVEYAAIQSVLPGPTQLMPSNNYQDLFLTDQTGQTNLTSGDVYAMYAQSTPPGIIPNVGDTSNDGDTTWTPADTTNLQRVLASARTFHQTVSIGPFHQNTFVLFGDGLTTDVEFDWNAGQIGVRGDTADLSLKIHQQPRQGKPSTGDGTVAVFSAQCPAATNSNATPAQPLGRFPFLNTEHSSCFANPNLSKQVEDCVKILMGM